MKVFDTNHLITEALDHVISLWIIFSQGTLKRPLNILPLFHVGRFILMVESIYQLLITGERIKSF